jgi:YD repeat-containing protein
VDLHNAPTGQYAYELDSGVVSASAAGVTGQLSPTQGKLVYVNDSSGPFGSGWDLAGLEQIIPDADGSVLLVDGDDSYAVYNKDQNGNFVSPPGDFSRVEQLPDGTYRRTLPNGTVYNFNAQDRLARVTDRNNLETDYLYDANGNLTAVRDAAGQENTFTYSGGRVTSITDPAGRTIGLGYDAAGNLVQVTSPDGTQTQYGYDAGHLLTSHTEPGGQRTTVSYNFAGLVNQIVHPDGGGDGYAPALAQGLYRPDQTADPVHAPLLAGLGAGDASTSDPNGNQTVYTFNADARLTAERDGAGPLFSVARDANDLVTRRTDAGGHVSFYQYDARGNLTSISDELSGGQDVSGSLSNPGETHTYTFTGTKGDVIAFSALDKEANGVGVQLLGPSGAALFFDSTFDSQPSPMGDQGPFTLPETGTYQLVFGGTRATGAYRFRLLEGAQAQQVTIGTPVTGALNPSTDTALFQVQGTAKRRADVAEADRRPRAPQRAAETERPGQAGRLPRPSQTTRQGD